MTVMIPTSIYEPRYFHQSRFHLTKECASSTLRVD